MKGGIGCTVGLGVQWDWVYVLEQIVEG